MDATCKLQDSILNLQLNNNYVSRILGTYQLDLKTSELLVFYIFIHIRFFSILILLTKRCKPGAKLHHLSLKPFYTRHSKPYIITVPWQTNNTFVIIFSFVLFKILVFTVFLKSSTNHSYLFQCHLHPQRTQKL